ncbi:serine/arginine repetitive matrix protein 2 [Drosophila pseudoobscura]|uniref:Serine/arginine repetitive matrix protein 2 n=1 Tax=Drosophila pseudoobscura pseudoobscura TaxID=46245 RepID=A0A6I8UQU6_DROPS|nr:serine/arginine repetitive matrix protein 2 [Drosophila pseudoobscura]
MMLAAAGLPAYDAGKINSNPSNGTAGGVGGTVGTPSAVGASRPSAASALMKTLSVRLHRGTEFIKDTVQKALVMSAPAPVAPAPVPSPAPPPVGSAVPPAKPITLTSQTLKRKLAGAGGLMGCGPSRITSITASSSSGRFILAHANRKPASQVPTEAYLKVYTVAPTELHRSAAARVRNPSTDSLLMDLCQFKPIRPMPLTPIKINKFRGFELKRPKFVPAVNDSEDEDDDEDDPESLQKPKPSSVILLPHKGSAFVPMPYIASPNTTAAAAITATATGTATRSRSRSHNTHTSGTSADEPKPKRRRRGPLLTARRRRTRAAAAFGAPPPVNTSASPEEVAAKPVAPVKRRAATKSGPAKRSRAAAANPTPVVATSTSPDEASKAPGKRKSSTKREPAKRSRAAALAAANPTPVTTSTSPGRAPRARGKRKTAPAEGPQNAKRSCRGSSPARPSPPMTRQRARKQISASSCHSGST